MIVHLAMVRHDYLRKGGAGLQAAGRPRSRSRGPDEIRAEGQHVSMGGSSEIAFEKVLKFLTLCEFSKVLGTLFS